MLAFSERVETGVPTEKPFGGEKRTTKLNSNMNRADTVELGLACDGGFMQKAFSRISLHSVLVPVQPWEHTVKGLKLRYTRNDALL